MVWMAKLTSPERHTALISLTQSLQRTGHRQGACNCCTWHRAATEASLVLCTPAGAASLSQHLLLLPSPFSPASTQQEHTTAEQGPQGSTGRMEEGRSSKFVWGIQTKEND